MNEPESLQYYLHLCGLFDNLEPVTTFYLALAIAKEYPVLASKLEATDPFQEQCLKAAQEFAQDCTRDLPGWNGGEL